MFNVQYPAKTKLKLLTYIISWTLNDHLLHKISMPRISDMIDQITEIIILRWSYTLINLYIQSLNSLQANDYFWKENISLKHNTTSARSKETTLWLHQVSTNILSSFPEPLGSLQSVNLTKLPILLMLRYRSIGSVLAIGQ